MNQMIKKEWIIWGAIIMLAAGLIVALVMVSNLQKKDAPSSTETTVLTQPTEPSSQETTLPGEGTEPTVPTTQPTTPTTPTGPTVPDETEPTEPDGDVSGGFDERPSTPPQTQDKPAPTDPTVPTEPDVTEPEETEPDETEPEETVPEDTTDPDETDPPDDGEMTYKEYEKLSLEEQIAFQNTFPSRNAFKEWYKRAKKEYEDSQHQVTIGPNGGLDIGDYLP